MNDLRLKLLRLTTSKPAVDMKELSCVIQEDAGEALRDLGANGLVSFSDGFLTVTCRQRVMLAEALTHSGVDVRRVSCFLRWQEFEDLAEHILSENGFSTRKHFIFKSSLGRREIDILAWNDMFVLAVDCKHWLRGSSRGRMKEAVRAQIERSAALARRPELLDRLKVPHAYRRSIIPLILALGDPRDHLIDGVPVVAVSRLMSFIYGVSPIDSRVKQVQIDSGSQSRIG